MEEGGIEGESKEGGGVQKREGGPLTAIDDPNSWGGRRGVAESLIGSPSRSGTSIGGCFERLSHRKSCAGQGRIVFSLMDFRGSLFELGFWGSFLSRIIFTNAKFDAGNGTRWKKLAEGIFSRICGAQRKSW